MKSITIGMACYEDYPGVWATVMDFLTKNSPSMLKELVEFVVVDNSPEGSGHTKLVENLMGQIPNGRMVRYEGPPSTTQPRQAIFEHAKNDIVLAVDCHITTPVNLLGEVMDYFTEFPDDPNLYSGPMVLYQAAHLINEDFLPNNTYETHFDPIWRFEMWGVWARDTRGSAVSNEPFEIPGQGLGLFTCLRDKWLGFNEHFRGFGGEELYIHEKYRQRGFKSFCHPAFRWCHRFGHPDGVRYTPSRWNKVRNYVLGHIELGLSLDPVYSHFVDLAPHMSFDELQEHLIEEHSVSPEIRGKVTTMEQLEQIHQSFKISEEEWKYLIKDPVANIVQPRKVEYKDSGLPVPNGTNTIKTPAELREWNRVAAPGDIHVYEPLLRSTFGSSFFKTATLFTTRRESAIIAADSDLELINVYFDRPDMMFKVIQELNPNVKLLPYSMKEVTTIGKTDILYVDAAKSGLDLHYALTNFVSDQTKAIVIHETTRLGQQDETGKHAGLWSVLQKFLKEHPDFYICQHMRDHYGMTMLCNVPELKPEEPIHIWPPGYGPGTELTKILESLGIKSSPKCDCKATAMQMDIAGWQRVSKEVDFWTETIKNNASRWGWSGVGSILTRAKSEEHLTVGQKIAAGFKAITSGIITKVNPLDPFPGLIHLSCDRAKEIEASLLSQKES